MHAKLPAALAIFLLLALTACVSSSSKLDHVRIGMGKDEVVALLGRPDTTRAQANIEYLTYYLSDRTSGRDQPYMVRLVDARVESFGRFFQLPDSYNRSVANAANSLGMGAVMPYSMNTDILTQLQQLKALKDQGVLTDEEFQRAKQRLLTDDR